MAIVLEFVLYGEHLTETKMSATLSNLVFMVDSVLTSKIPNLKDTICSTATACQGLNLNMLKRNRFYSFILT